jgi:T5SS/PEP-CTERM-associated repeat protein
MGMKRLLAGGLALVARAIRFATGADQARHGMAAGQRLRRAPCRALRFSATSDKRVSRSVASLATVAAVVVGWTAILPLSRAQADNFWTGNTSKDWNTPSNWSVGVPNGVFGTTIDTASPNSTVLNGGTGTTHVLFVGQDGTGTLTIQNGGALTIGGSGFNAIGVDTTGIGTVTVDGAGSTLTNNNATFFVGFGGTGTLTIQNGGTVIGVDTIGHEAGSTGTVTVDGVDRR